MFWSGATAEEWGQSSFFGKFPLLLRLYLYRLHEFFFIIFNIDSVAMRPNFVITIHTSRQSDLKFGNFFWMLLLLTLWYFFLVFAWFTDDSLSNFSSSCHSFIIVSFLFFSIATLHVVITTQHGAGSSHFAFERILKGQDIQFSNSETEN